MIRFAFGRQPALFASLALALALPPVAARAADQPAKPAEEAAPAQRAAVSADQTPMGLYYERYEPTFYTGFAPRALDPKRIHLHIGRGNQLRATVVLSDKVLQTYDRDLQVRRETYRRLIEDGKLVLTQNTGFEQFEKTLNKVGLDRLVSEGQALADDALRARNLALLERLNPGRVFHIRMPVDEVMRRWVMTVTPEDRKGMIRGRQLEVLNAMLPTRMFVADWHPDITEPLAALVALAPAPEAAGDPGTLEPMRAAFLQLLDRYTHGRYPVVDGNLAFTEFTAIYPIGSFNQYTEYRGQRIPMYPTPGRRSLKTHQRTKTVDHIPTKQIYSYSPWIPYMHVGSRLHNSFHTLWWRMEPGNTAFLPEEMRSAPESSRSGKPYRYLWLLSRGPMSHGCTHVTTGHIAELRQILPADTAAMYEVDTFLNKSHQFDVFDIDGDFEPEVVGVTYFIAYGLKNKRPHRLRAEIGRRAFYEWLYGGALAYEADGTGVFTNVTDGQFVGRKALDGRSYDRLRLYEAEYEPERVQFYKLVDIPFARELRKVGTSYRPGEGAQRILN
ncbi:MAG: hypothetical protein QNJ94_22520 [Alphaproteobacteria bacterium]|nr:hypothetical protein [Alphaproteobacteria bacterium]